MKKFILIFVGVLFLSLPGGVRAEEVVVDPVGVEVEVPDVTSRWFGVSWAFERVKHNFEVWIARTDEKKIELDLKFVEKEEKLVNKIVELEETNPRLAEKLGVVVDKLKEKRVERMERIEMRIEKMGEKGEIFEQKKKEIKERISQPLLRKVPVPAGQGMGIEDPVELRGDGVKIKNAKPGVVRMR